jgi:hypothetical protein
LGFWTVLAAGVVLGATGAWLLRRSRPRTAALVGGALAVLLPLSAVAVPFTFANGTVADATQVNANFAALAPVNGFSYVGGTPSGSFWPIMTPTFTASRAMVCTVSTTVTTTMSDTVSGVAILFPSKSENGSVASASAPPLGGAPVVYLMPGAGTGVYQASQTVQYSVGAGSTVAFGVQMNTVGNFATAATGWKMAATYTCD